MNNLTRRFGSLFGSLIALVIVLVLYVVAGRLVFQRIQMLQATIVAAESEKGALAVRVSTLQESQGVVVSSTSTKLVEALPEKNPSLFVVGQLRSEASTQQVILDNLDLSSQTSEGGVLSHLTVEFDIRGNYDQVSAFIMNISKALPVMKINSLRITEAAGNIEAKIAIESYWSPFPESLPTISEPIQGLTDSEIETLNTLSGFKELTISEAQPNPEEETQRQDPFSLAI